MEPSLPEDRLQEFQGAFSERYQIRKELGAGGMGIVYLAEDVRHEREVAIKVLRPEIAVSVGTERFLREVRLEASLSHPHILSIYDSGEAAGLLFCVMPLVKGESLRDRLAREKQLPFDDALRICREIADALAFAHGNDVIHRDVKPANILLEAGHAVLADFGLARAVTVAGDEALTRTGFAVGTPAYSSPEQASGEEAVDGRSDLYSLGCVLYEMLAGQPPFVGPSLDSVVRQHLTTDSPSVRVIRPSVPEAAEEILTKLLAKSPADRFKTGEELIAALDAAISGEWKAKKGVPTGWRWGRWKHVAAAAAIVALLAVGASSLPLLRPSGNGAVSDLADPGAIAVLYFDDVSAGSELQHVADGLTESLIDQLERVRELDVVSRNGVAPFRGSTLPLDSIAAALEVGTLIHGDLDAVGEGVRVSLELVEGTSGSPIDRTSFDVPSSRLLEAQDSVARDAAFLLRERLGEEVRLRRRRESTEIVEAWALVQRGERERKEAETQILSGDLEAAFVAFHRADSLYQMAGVADPDWVEPMVLQARTAYRRSRYAATLEAALEGIASAVAFADRALAQDPNEARALEWRGSARYWHFVLGVIPDSDEAEAMLQAARTDLEAAVELDPLLAGAHSTLSHLHYAFGDVTSALLAARLAYEADAYLDVAHDVIWRAFLASYDLERSTQARNWCNEGHERFPESYRFWECRILAMGLPPVTGDPQQAWHLFETMIDLTPEPRKAFQRSRGMMLVAGVIARSELADSARNVLLAARAGADVDLNLELPFLEAHVRVVLGDYDEAVDLLWSYMAEEAPVPAQAEDWASYWWWRDMRGHEGFEALVEAAK